MKTDLQSLHQLAEPVKACVGSADQHLVNIQLMYAWFISLLHMACSSVALF